MKPLILAVLVVGGVLGSWTEFSFGEAASQRSEKSFSKTQAIENRRQIWSEYLNRFRSAHRDEWQAKSIVAHGVTFRWKERVVGEMPAGGWPLFVTLHGGGNAPAEVNDQQWENQIKLYDTFDNCLVIAPRAPTNSWNLWHESPIDGLLDQLIADAVALGDVNPDRVYLIGYSAGGDGVYQLAPRMADRFAAAMMCAGHPNNAQPIGLRNLSFAIHVGALDAGYDRNLVAKKWGEELDELQAADPGGYEHAVQLHDNRAHWMNQEEQASIPWLQQKTRDPVPSRIAWLQGDVTHDSFYWLSVPPGSAKPEDAVIAERDGQTIRILRSHGVSKLIVRLDDRIIDLDQPVRVMAGQTCLFDSMVSRSAAVQQQTLAERGDQQLIFDAQVCVQLPAGGVEQIKPPTAPSQHAGADDAVVDMAAVDHAVDVLKAHLPARDRGTISIEFLKQHVRPLLASRQTYPWSSCVPQELFDEFVLPYANVDESRDAWANTLKPIAAEIVTHARTAGEAIVELNDQLFKRINVQYNATKRLRPNQGVTESMRLGYASCTGLSILLVDACRSVAIPARLVGIADWVSPAGPTYTGNGNHAWVEAWDGRQWRFIGASEPGELDMTWFVEQASRSIATNPMQAIYATSYVPTGEHFPLVWSTADLSVPGINVTSYYADRKSVHIDAPSDATVEIRDGGRLVAAGPAGDFIVAGHNDYSVEISAADGAKQCLTEHVN